MAPTAGQIITCKAAVCWSPKEPLVLENVQVDPPQKGEVRVKILFTSLCHSDVTFWLDKPKIGFFPRIFGHEASGIIESVGEGVTEFQEGDHVLPVFTGECKECRHCKSTKSNLCAKYRLDPRRGVMLSDNKSRFSVGGKAINHFLGSTFSEYTVLEQEYVVKVNPAAPLEKICILSCGVTTGHGEACRGPLEGRCWWYGMPVLTGMYPLESNLSPWAWRVTWSLDASLWLGGLGSSWKFAKVEKGSSVAIFGLGTIGLGVAEGARLAGASRVIGVDINPMRFEKARKFGMTEFINPSDHDKPVHEVIRDMTDGGVDYSFECVGSARVVETALLSCHDGWGMTVVCGVEGESNTVCVHPGVFLYGRTLTGAFFGGIKPKSELPKVVEMCINKEVQLDEFITHTLPFDQINEAFTLMLEGKSLRCVMHM